MKARIVSFLLDNHLFAPFVSLSVLLLAVATASVPLLIVSGVLAYGWPFFYVYLLDVKEALAEDAKKAKRPHSIRPSAATAA